MRIMHLIPKLSGGGAERQLSYLAPELARRGHDVHIVFSREGPNPPELPGVTLHRLIGGSNCDPRLAWRLVRLIRLVKPDVLHSWILQMDVLGGIAARLTGTPWVLREPNMSDAYPASWKTRLRLWAGAGARAVISNSGGGDAYWKARVPDRKRYIVRNGLPMAEIERAPAALPARVAVPDVPLLVYVGRLERHKRVQTFLDALAIVSKRRAVHGVVCGEGAEHSSLEARVRALGLAEHVTFTGFLPSEEVWALLKNAAAFVSLSSYEGCPNTVMEAIACGCPLVLSDIPPHRELLGEGPTAWVDPVDAVPAAEAIVGILENLVFARSAALAARHRANEWSVPEVARQYEFIYNEILGRHQAGSLPGFFLGEIARKSGEK